MGLVGGGDPPHIMCWSGSVSHWVTDDETWTFSELI